MADFPENGVQVLPAYISFNVRKVISALEDAIVVDPKLQQTTGELVREAKEVLRAREQFRDLLQNPQLAAVRQQLELVYQQILALRDFEDALNGIRLITPSASIPQVDMDTMQLALKADRVKYTVVFFDVANQHLAFVDRFVPGYGGPRPTAARLKDFTVLVELARGGPERDWRLGLLRAECRIGLRQIVSAPSGQLSALAEYAKLQVDPDTGPTKRKFLAIRAGAAHLAAADALFRGSRNLSDAVRAKAGAAYESAVSVLGEHNVSPDNPSRVQIENHAKNRLAMLAERVNVLGLRDSLVPPFRHQFLLGLTLDHIGFAREAIQAFVTYQTKADDLDAAELETAAELEIAGRNIDIARDELKAAAARAGATAAQIAEIDRQLEILNGEDLEAETFQTAFQELGQVVAAGAQGAAIGGAPGAVVGVAVGLASVVAGRFSRKNELEFQMRLAELDQRIAGLQAAVAESEVHIAIRREEFLQDEAGPRRRPP